MNIDNPPPAQRAFLQRVGMVVAVVVQIGSTALPALGMGEPIGSRSDDVGTLITPAGWAFAIWGPLYLGSVIFAIWQFLPGQRDNTLLDRIGWPAAGVFFANGVWAIYTQSAALTFISALIIITGLACVLTVLRRFVHAGRPFTNAERWIAVLPLSALAAWLTAATIVNISAAVQFHGMLDDPAQYPIIAAVMVVTGGVIAAVAVFKSRGNPWYALVFGWALTAIHAKGGQVHDDIAMATILAGVLVAAAMAAGLANKGNRAHWLG